MKENRFKYLDNLVDIKIAVKKLDVFKAREEDEKIIEKLEQSGDDNKKLWTMKLTRQLRTVTNFIYKYSGINFVMRRWWMKGWKEQNKFLRMTKDELKEFINISTKQYQELKENSNDTNTPVMAFIIFKSMSNTKRVKNVWDQRQQSKGWRDYFKKPDPKLWLENLTVLNGLEPQFLIWENFRVS